MAPEMMHSGTTRAALAARALTVAAGIALFASLLLTWSSLSLQQLALMAVTANGSLGHISLSQSAWDVDPGAAAALTAVAIVVIATGVLTRLPLILPAEIVVLGALVFVIVQFADPPSALPAHLGTALPSTGTAARSAAGSGETTALVALIAAGIGMWAMLAVAHAQRRRGRPRGGGRTGQRAIGSAARPPRAGVSAGGPADGSA